MHCGHRRAGYGVTLQQGVSALVDLGLRDKAISYDVPSSSHYVFDPTGKILGFFGRSFTGDGVGRGGKNKFNVHVRYSPFSRALSHRCNKCVKSMQPCSCDAVMGWTAYKLTTASTWQIPRQLLRKMMMDQVEPGCVRWGSRVQGIEECDGGERVRILLEGGDQVVADLVVGADGIRSRIRQEVTSEMPRFMGVMVIMGISTMVGVIPSPACPVMSSFKGHEPAPGMATTSQMCIRPSARSTVMGGSQLSCFPAAGPSARARSCVSDKRRLESPVLHAIPGKHPFLLPTIDVRSQIVHTTVRVDAR